MTAPFALSDAKIRLMGGRIFVNALVAHQHLLKSVPGARWDNPTRAWAFDATPTAAAALLVAFKDLQVDAPNDFLELALLGAEKREVIARKEDIVSASLPEVPWAARPLWAHQKACFWYAANLLRIADPATERYLHPQTNAPDLGGAGIFMEMGTGKSAVAISLIQASGARLTLIACPNSVVGVWPNQFREHAATAQMIVPLRGPARKSPISVKEKTEMAERAVAIAGARGLPLTLIINYESLFLDPFAKWALKQPWDMLVFDESHRIKSPNARVSMFAATLARRARRRLALTGTPLPHSPLDIYGQYRAVDPGIFGTSYARFRDRYAITDPMFRSKVVSWLNQGELTDRIYEIAYRVTKEVLDLPEQVHVQRTCRLGPEARRVYDEMARDLIAQLAEGPMTAANALVRLLRLQQVASGYATVERVDEHGVPQREQVEIGDEKRRLLEETLDELPAGEPVVVFAVFRKDLDNIRRVAEERGLRYGELSGRDKGGITEDSQMAPDVDVLGVQLRSGGVGIDLTRAATAIYYSMGFSLGDYDQSLSRLHRPGQDRPVRYVHLLAEDTVDGHVYRALKQRKDVIDSVLGDVSAALFANEED